MTCKPTQLPSDERVDIAALRARYEIERDKRLNADHTNQYVRPTGAFEAVYQSDPHTPFTAREAISE